MVIENALTETVESTIQTPKGPRTTSKQKYTVSQIVDTAFRLPLPVTQQPDNPWVLFLNMPSAGSNGLVRHWTYVGPTEPPEGQEFQAPKD